MGNPKLTLIEADKVQKNRSLVIEGPVPTIEQYKRNPGNYNTIDTSLTGFIFLAMKVDDGFVQRGCIHGA